VKIIPSMKTKLIDFSLAGMTSGLELPIQVFFFMTPTFPFCHSRLDRESEGINSLENFIVSSYYQKYYDC